MKFLLFICLLLVISCSKKSDELISNLVKASKVVLIFEYIPDNSKYVFTNGISTNSGFELQYLDDHLIPHLITPDPDSKADTITITSLRNIIEIRHAYRGADELSFFFLNGDTALFKYVDKRPRVIIKNKVLRDFDVNYETKMRDVVYGGGFPSTIKYDVPFAFSKVSSLMEYKILQNDYKSKSFEEFNMERHFLDSLATLNKLSSVIADLFILQNRYDSLSFAIKSNELALFPVKYLASDSLLYYGFYNDFLDRIIHSYYSRKIQRIKDGNALVSNFNVIYDSIKNNKSFTKLTRNVLLRKTLEEIVQSNLIEVIEQYYNDFLITTGDTLLWTYIGNKFRLNFNKSNQLNLISAAHKLISFDDLLKAHKGSIVYVDFWASWCSPCIQQFPSSKKLIEKYKGKNVSFIYLSIDSDSVKWRKATSKYELSNSFLIDNKYSSKLVEELKVMSIPRYLLYDKTGKIVHENAPRPESDAIIKLIESHL